MEFLFPLLIIGLFVFFCLRFYKRIKVPKLSAFNFISGGVKCGKTSFALGLALKSYKQNVRYVWLYNHFFRFLHIRKELRNEKLEMPLFYSNIPMTFAYVPITRELVLRKERFSYRSIVFIDEVSLLADSQLIKDNDINMSLLKFCKLIGHELGAGGKLFVDSQCIGDSHYAFKRCMSQYQYVHSVHKVPFLPLLIFKVRELFYSDDNSSLTNVAHTDIEDDLKTCVISSKVWKYFDAYTYSCLTDDLPVNNNVVYAKSLKCDDIVSFRNYTGGINEKK